MTPFALFGRLVQRPTAEAFSFMRPSRSILLSHSGFDGCGCVNDVPLNVIWGFVSARRGSDGGVSVL